MLFIINTVIIKCILRIVFCVGRTDRDNIFIMYITLILKKKNVYIRDKLW